MVILSTLRTAGYGCKSAVLPLLRGSVSNVTRRSNIIARSMGSHGRKMDIVPSKFEYNRWKDQLHFYTLLGVIPLALLVRYVNLFYGPAELAEIPDDYEPQHWEYYKHPISRWIAKFYYSPEVRYEQHLHVVLEEQKKRDMRQLEKKVKSLMGERGDYKGWYYVPKNSESVYVAYETTKEDRSMDGTSR